MDRGGGAGRLQFWIAKTRRLCGRRPGRFYLAKEARRGEPRFKGIGVGKGSDFAGSGFDGMVVLPAPLAGTAKFFMLAERSEDFAAKSDPARLASHSAFIGIGA